MIRWLLQWWQGRKVKQVQTPHADEIAAAQQPTSAPQTQPSAEPSAAPDVPAAAQEIAPTPTLSTQDHIQAFLGADRIQALQALARPTLAFKLEPMSSDERSVSKLGGAPYWPKHAWGSTPYPTGASGKPLAFLAQINCSELPAGLLHMPKQGMLQFYIANNDLYGCDVGGDLIAQENFRVIYWPDTILGSYETSVIEGDSLPHKPTMPARMRWSLVTQQAASSGSWHFEQILGVNHWQETQAYCTSHNLDHAQFFDALFTSNSATGHRIGGHPAFTQSDPRADDSVVNLKKYELLFQLDTDDTAHLMWGDAGIGSFFITDEALAKRDFNKVMYTWDCS
jgi:uncharacterized protein YwqG